ncbi:MAG: BlaI/MecI/CopY family transcriptional regulator [Litorimonas sp.]
MKNGTPTAAETIALQILWDRGVATAPELHEEICKSGKVGYTTVLKRLQRMEEKGLVVRVAKKGRAISYKATRKPETTRKTLVSRLIRQAFGDSPNALIQHAISEHDLSSEDIAQLRELLDRIDPGTGR